MLCLICARKGSKRLLNKNLRKINGISLIGIAINHAKSCSEIDEIIVSTDSNEIAAESENFGAKVPFLRPAKLGDDTTPEWKVWQHALKFYKNGMPKELVILPTTAPIREKKDICSAINTFKSNICDGVISVTDSHRNPSFNIVKEDDENYLELAISKSKKIFRSQDGLKYFDITTVCYIMKTSFILNNNHMFDGKLKLNYVPKERSVDIDTELDLNWAKFLYNNNNIK